LKIFADELRELHSNIYPHQRFKKKEEEKEKELKWML